MGDDPLSKFSQKGLLCFWNEDDFVLQNSISGNGYIGLEGTWLEGNRQVTIVNVYSPFDLEGKRALWLELKNLKALSSNSRWCATWDFNAIRRRRERIGVNNDSQGGREMEDFNQFIKDLELINVPLVRKKYTCFQPNGKEKSHIYRVLISIDWLETWHSCTQCVLNRNVFLSL